MIGILGLWADVEGRAVVKDRVWIESWEASVLVIAKAELPV
jgi:hypothetical protein